LYAIDATGTQSWEYTLSAGLVNYQPAYANGTLYFVQADPNVDMDLVSYNATTGSQNWATNLVGGFSA
jgi:outer membrane protein assembly factor BamB